VAARRIHTGIGMMGWDGRQRKEDGMNGRKDRLLLSENNNTTRILGRIYISKVQSRKVKEKNQTEKEKSRKNSSK
jgi:hypothetical protein